jgi:hypothetical protein
MNAVFDALAEWMLGTWLHRAVTDHAWSWPALEALHFVGLCVLIGAVLVMNLRLIGFRRMIPLRSIGALMPIAIAGFVVQGVTGVGFLFGSPASYFTNPAFQLKMLLVVLAGLNFLLYYFTVDPLVVRVADTSPTPVLGKVTGIASLVLWFGVLACGRLLPFFGSGAG